VKAESRPGRESTTASTGSASSDGCSSSGEHVDQDGPAHPNLDVVLAQELGETGVRIGAPGHDHVQETDNSYYTQPSFVGSSILTGQPEVWTRAARLNEGGP
jgi:hypothetical protein